MHCRHLERRAAVGPGQTLTVSSGETSTGVDVLSGGTLLALAGATASGAVIDGGGSEIVPPPAATGVPRSGAAACKTSARAAAPMGLLSAATVCRSSKWRTADNTILTRGGTGVVLGLGIDASVGSGGLDIVASGGTDSGATISGGTSRFRLRGRYDRAGAQIVQSDGTAGDTVLSGGSEVVGAGGTDISAQISGGEQDVFGNTIGVTLVTGSQVIERGGSASGTTVSGGTRLVAAGGTASATTIATTASKPSPMTHHSARRSPAASRT